MNAITLIPLSAPSSSLEYELGMQAALEKARFSEVELETGVRLHYAEQGDSSGPAVILLHGYSDSWFSFSRVLPLLPPEIHAFALDLRGHGDSAKPFTGYAMRDLAEDVTSFMEAMQLEGVTIAGHSMGSFVAQQVALTAPGRVERLLLIGSTTTPRTLEGIFDLREAVHELTDPVSRSFVVDFQMSTIHHPVPSAFMDRVIAESLKLPARAWKSVMEGMLATPEAKGLSARHMPVLLLRGDHDAFATSAEQEALLELLGRAELGIYEDTGHALHWERPDEFARDLVRFVTQSQLTGRAYR